jgi:hypothetical protein
MKNEYFGDDNDYRKYGLLRSLPRTSNMKLLVAWMLTGRDEEQSNDGQSRSYLEKEDRFGGCDPELYDWLREKRGEGRSVSHIENSQLLHGATFYSEVVQDDRAGRQQWAEGLYRKAESADVVFLDPDIGIEVASKPCEGGRKGSSKYVAWAELEKLWNAGKSLLIYQHFAHAEHEAFIRSKLHGLKEHLRTPVPYQLSAFITPKVVFLLALQKQVDFEVGEAWIKSKQLERWSDPAQ